MNMNKVGVGNDQFQFFLSEDYKRSVELGLTTHNIASYLIDSLREKILDYFQESIDSLEKEGVRLFSFTTVVNMFFLLSINSFVNLKKLQVTTPHDKFESLRQFARGEQTDLPGLKISVAKAIELLLLSTSRKHNKLTRTLTEALLLLLRDTSG